MTKNYILNPLAPEFIPKAVYTGPAGHAVFMPQQGPLHGAWIGQHPGAAYRGPNSQVWERG
ncbi:hypothetical protein DPMN_034502 [Dreissena polymorpha]|uniref:Uncharacterized protein n=1 Tax=Dreissena polymorpha TaxID=45954 RepID=A0A9D4RM56_DREPO|nr:hypothetical protein DPMN_034502 [Dreissena polymorpha]